MRWLAAIAAVAATMCSAPLAAQEGKLGALSAQLFYKESGRLSDDLLARDPPFSGWNTVIGEGDAEEPAEDLLVAVRLLGTGEEAFLDETLTLWVTDERGREIARREFSGLLVPYRGGVSFPLWLGGVGCAGRLLIHARFRAEERRGELRLDCGE